MRTTFVLAPLCILLLACKSMEIDPGRPVHRQLVDRGVTTSGFDGVLRKALETYPIANAAKVNLSAAYDDSKINIAVVDSQKYEDLWRAEPRNGLRFPPDQLYLNAIAVPPSLIIIDSDWLTLLLVAARSRTDALPKQERLRQRNTALSAADFVRARMAVDDLRRGVAVDAFMRRTEDRLRYRDTATAIIRETDLTALATVNGAVWLPFLAHEFAHLEDRTRPVAARAFHPADSPLPDSIRKAEEQADQVALERLGPVIGYVNALATEDPDDAVSSVALQINLSLESYALLQRDMVLQRVFDDFRGSKYYDLMSVPLYRNCDLNAPQRVDPFAFDNALIVLWNPIPAFTDGEMLRLRQYLDPVKYRTHLHGFERAAALSSKLKSVEILWGQGQIADFLALLTYVRTGQPMPVPDRQRLPRMNLKLADFMKRFEESEKAHGDRYVTEKLENCQLDECFLVRQTAVPGRSESEFVEVWAEDGEVVSIRYRYPTFKPAGSAEAAVKMPDWLRNRLEAMTAGQPPEMQSPEVPLLEKYHMSNMIVVSALFLSDDGRISLRQLLETTLLAHTFAVRCGAGAAYQDFEDRYFIARPTVHGNGIDVFVGGKIPP